VVTDLPVGEGFSGGAMPAYIRIIQATEFLKVTTHGTLDLKESQRVLLQLAATRPSSPDFEVILDNRHVRSLLSVQDLWYFAAELAKLRILAGRKTAVLCPRERFDYAKFLALCAQNRGLQVQAFTSFEEAIDWLTA
jgi:hypothetical protein